MGEEEEEVDKLIVGLYKDAPRGGGGRGLSVAAAGGGGGQGPRERRTEEERTRMGCTDTGGVGGGVGCPTGKRPLRCKNTQT